MNETYYDRLIDEIRNLISVKDFNKALQLIDNELSMPYIPMETEKLLIGFKTEICSETFPEKKRYFLSKDEVRNYLFQNDEKSDLALQFLSSSNIREYLDIIEDYFLSENNDCFIITELITLLKNQHLNRQFKLLKNGIVLSINPIELPYVFQQPEFEKIYEDLDHFFENENPSFLQMTKQTLISFAFSLYPITISEQDHDKILYSIIRYVFDGYDDEEGFIQFAREHNINSDNLIKISI